MADPKQKEHRVEGKPDGIVRPDFITTVTDGINMVMRDRKNMRGLELAFDEALRVEANKTEDHAKLRNDLRKQLQDGRLALESLESRLMQAITG